MQTGILGSVLNFVTYFKNDHNGGSEILRYLSKKALSASVSWRCIYTLNHVCSTWYIKVTICGTLPNSKYKIKQVDATNLLWAAELDKLIYYAILFLPSTGLRLYTSSTLTTNAAFGFIFPPNLLLIRSLKSSKYFPVLIISPLPFIM